MILTHDAGLVGLERGLMMRDALLLDIDLLANGVSERRFLIEAPASGRRVERASLIGAIGIAREDAHDLFFFELVEGDAHLAQGVAVENLRESVLVGLPTPKLAVSHLLDDHLVDIEVRLALVQGLHGLVSPDQVRLGAARGVHVALLVPVGGGQEDVGPFGSIGHALIGHDNEVDLGECLFDIALLGVDGNGICQCDVETLDRDLLTIVFAGIENIVHEIEIVATCGTETGIAL